MKTYRSPHFPRNSQQSLIALPFQPVSFPLCLFSALAIALIASLLWPSTTQAQLPHLVDDNGSMRLMVDGAPYLILGGQLGNSTAGGLEHLRQHWETLVNMNLNTVIAPVYWDRSEPKKGVYDWTLLNGLIEQAREHDLRLILLWYGSWKNSMSCYAPNWVKADLERFPRVETSEGRLLEILSPFSKDVLAADRKAFRAMMEHLRKIDGKQHTVLMVQVQNEIGMIHDARDHSPLAEAAWDQPVPQELIQSLLTEERAGTLVPEFAQLWNEHGRRTEGSWTEVFGPAPASEEIFMAWYFARFVEEVSLAGLEAYELPLFVNAALIRPAFEPGQYVSAGPLPHLLNIWRAGAPSISMITPDIYFPNFAHWAGLYHRAGNPLLIPEALRNEDASVNALYAFGQHEALGFAPFGIEAIEPRAGQLLTQSYEIIRQLTPLLSEKLGQGATRGLLPPAPGEQRQPHRVRLNDVILNVTYERVTPPALADGVINESGDRPASLRQLPAGGLVIALGPDEFIFAGTGVTVTFASKTPGEQIGILEAEEGRFENGQWINEIWLGGDQTHQGRHLRLVPGQFSIQRIQLYRYPLRGDSR